MLEAIRPVHGVSSLVFALGLVLTACGDDGPTTVEVTAVDFAFEGLPDELVAGSTITMTNESGVELHEFVAIRLPEEETRSVEELIAQPQGLAPYFPNVAAVILAPPGEDGITIEGSQILIEPGRYAIICAIPTGANPAEYMAAAADLFTAEATYSYRPWQTEETVAQGRDAIAKSWLRHPDEPGSWAASYETFVVEESRAVAVGTSRYFASGDDPDQLYHNAFLLEFDGEGRCSRFTEYWMIEEGGS